MLSELSPQALSWRSLARWTGDDSRIYRAGKSASLMMTRADSDETIDRAQRAALDALDGPLGQARRYIRIPKGTLNTQGGAKFITELRRLVGAWKSHLSAAHHCDVWPVVIIDPIQRFQETSRGEVEALGDLIEALGSVPMDGRFGPLTSLCERLKSPQHGF